MVTQTIQFETVSPSEIGSGTVTAFLFSGENQIAELASITENATLKGRHTGTVADIGAAEYRLVVKFNGYTISEPDEVVTLLLAVGTYVSARHAVLDSTASTKIDSILEDTGTTLLGLIGGIPKVGSTHRYTQVAQTSTTTDVSIGEAT
jgi:hypothetical protein